MEHDLVRRLQLGMSYRVSLFSTLQRRQQTVWLGFVELGYVAIVDQSVILDSYNHMDILIYR
jgi:hypothetical protein